MKVNSNVTSNALVYDTNSKTTRPSITNENANRASHNQIRIDAPVEVEISEQARNMSLELKEYGANSFFKRDEEFLRQDLKEQRKLDFAKNMAEREEIDPFDNEFQLLGVKYTFNEGTLGKFITDALEGKATNASLVASELNQMIRGAVHNPNATVEERATNREIALKNAEYIAQNYFDNPDEAKAFLDEINRYAENDILREKGYVVFDNSNMEPFKSYTMPNAPSGYIRGSEYAKKYGADSMREIFEDPKKYESFVKSMNSNAPKWGEEIIKSFDENEKKVSDIISNIKNSLSETDITASLQRILKAFYIKTDDNSLLKFKV